MARAQHPRTCSSWTSEQLSPRCYRLLLVHSCGTQTALSTSPGVSLLPRLVKLVQPCVLGPPLEPLAAYLEGGKTAPIGCGPWLPDCCREPLLSPLPYPTTCLYLRLWPVLGTDPQNRPERGRATGSAHACITFDEGRRVWKREVSVQRALLLSWPPHSCILTSGAATLWIDN